MKHVMSDEDQAFKEQFEKCEYPVSEFDHRAHLRLAFAYLTENDVDASSQLMRDSLLRFLDHNGVDPTKYHHTLTHAWILAVRHFMEESDDSASADLFIEQHPEMLDSKIMMTHYSAEVLFSDEARERFVNPNIDPIPRHEG